MIDTAATDVTHVTHVTDVGAPAAPRPRAMRSGAGTAPGGPAGRRPAGGATPRPATGRPPRRDLGEAVRGFAMLWLEVERGQRPLRQLRHLVSAELLDRLEQVTSRGAAPARVAGCAGMRTAADVYEGVVLLAGAGRRTAMCVTLRREGGGTGAWRVTDLGRPEAGPLPPARCLYPPDHDDPDAPADVRWHDPTAEAGGSMLTADWCPPAGWR